MILDARGKMVRPPGFDDENLVSLRSTPFDPAFKEDGYLDNSLRQDLEALRALPGVVAATNTCFLPWQGGGSSTELKPVGAQGRDAAHADLQRRRGHVRGAGRQVTEGRAFTREHVDTDTLRLRKLFADQRRSGPDGRPAEKFVQDVVISRALREAGLRRGLAARQDARGHGRRPVPRHRRDRRASTTPTAGPSTSTRSSSPTAPAATRAARRSWCAPSRARRRRWPRRLEQTAARGQRRPQRRVRTLARDQGPVLRRRSRIVVTLMGAVIVAAGVRDVAGDRGPHVVLGHRAHAADRHPPRAGRAPRGHPAALPAGELAADHLALALGLRPGRRPSTSAS